MRFNGKRALVVGGTGAIGYATARLLQQGGAEVVITGRTRERALERASSLGGGAKGLAADPADEAALRAACEATGAFDYLVVTLGTQSVTLPFAQLSEAELQRAMADKYLAYTRVLRAALPYVRESVTWLTGAAARSAAPGLGNYAAPNGALHALMGPLAAELAPVRINCVAAGVTRTDFWRGVGLPPDAEGAMYREWEASTPLRHVADPAEIADAIAFAASNTFTTGTILDTCGGFQLSGAGQHRPRADGA